MSSPHDVFGFRWNTTHPYTALPSIFFTAVSPTPVPAPHLVILNAPLATTLGLSADALKQNGALRFAGNDIPPAVTPIAQAYAGHQFGHLNMLGDGRAILLGEHVTPEGDVIDMQLKGSGRTPYSRGGDGRAALGPMLREYLLSEAMHALRIPTTRSLAVVTTGDTIFRHTAQPGAILTRTASSHLRVGTFQWASQWGSPDAVRALAEYTIQRHFPMYCNHAHRFLHLLDAVIARQAYLIAQWQLVGFIHGVMNTDNMTISGETIDYGPCAFLDTYDPNAVFSAIDTYGRYAYGNQPTIGVWNIARFAETLLPLLHAQRAQAIPIAERAITQFSVLFRQHWLTGMCKKIGLCSPQADDESLIYDLLRIMQHTQADYTLTFRALANETWEHLPVVDHPPMTHWIQRWKKRIQAQDEPFETVQARMKQANPAVIPRNGHVEFVLAAATQCGDLQPFEEFLHLLTRPFDEPPPKNRFATLPPPLPAAYRTHCGT